MLHPTNQPHVSLPAPVMPPSRKSDLPRLFTLTYDSSKLKSKDPQVRAEFTKRYECEGVLFTNGHVILDSGVMFRNVLEMRDHFDVMGTYHIVWSNGDEETNALQGSEKRIYMRGRKA